MACGSTRRAASTFCMDGIARAGRAGGDSFLPCGGASLGYFFCTFLLTSIVTPFLAVIDFSVRDGKENFRVVPRNDGATASAQARSIRRFEWMVAPAALVIGIVACWVGTLENTQASVFDLGRCVVVLVTYLAMIGALARLLAQIGIASVLAAAIISTISLGWLTWPVWLSGALGAARPDDRCLAGSR